MKKIVFLLLAGSYWYTATAQQTLTIQETVLFGHDLYGLDEHSKAQLEALCKKIQSLEQYSISISGHTNNIGSEAYNNALSLKRAEMIKEYLIKKGFSSDKIAIASFGESKPKISNLQESGIILNRRTEIIVSYQKPINASVVTSGKQGAKIKSSDPDIVFEIEEIYSSEAMLAKNMSTMTTNNEVLASSGVLCVEARNTKGKSLDKTEAEYEMLVPIKRGGFCNFDNLLFWDAKAGENAIIWQETKMKISKQTIDGIEYYVVSTNETGCFNFDCKPPVCVVEIKVKQNAIQKFNVVYENIVSVITPEKKGQTKNKYIVKLITGDDQPEVIIETKKTTGGQYSTKGLYLDKLKYIKHKNLYIVKRSDFKKVEQENTSLGKI